MKIKLLMFLLSFGAAIVCVAQNDYSQSHDTISVTSLDDIINTESQLYTGRGDLMHYRGIWGKNSYVKIGYNTTTLSSTEFPTVDGKYDGKYDNSWGLGFQYGHVFNFHKNPIGDVLFIGLDYTGIDLNVNRYNETKADMKYEFGNEKPYCLPWHNKKWLIDYSMLLGPSLTLYPFTSLRKNGTDNIRLQLYFQIGYNVGIAVINDVLTKNNKTENPVAFGHGFTTNFGFNATWDFVGIGYESNTISNMTYEAVDSEYKTGSFNAKRTISRVYIQFRF